MGEARQRRLAREAGRPWDVDVHKPEAPPRYLGDDGEWHEHRERKPNEDPAALRAVLVASILLGGVR